MREEERKLVLSPFSAEDHPGQVKQLEEAIAARLPILEITNRIFEVYENNLRLYRYSKRSLLRIEQFFEVPE